MKNQKTVTIENHTIFLANPVQVPNCEFIGRKQELRLCKAAWNVQSNKLDSTENIQPLNFRLQGPPGVGKNEIVYELARTLNMPLYIIQGHSELTSEDLSLLLVPDPINSSRNTIPLVLRASPLATAIHEGGLFFFDEINRVPEKALSPLSSVLDSRHHIYSAMTGITIGPKDEHAKSRFRFCCSLNPEIANSGHVLPEYIEQRTLPVIEVENLEFEDLYRILENTVHCSKQFLRAFELWYDSKNHENISVRQLIAMFTYATTLKKTQPNSELDILNEVVPYFFGN